MSRRRTLAIALLVIASCGKSDREPAKRVEPPPAPAKPPVVAADAAPPAAASPEVIRSYRQYLREGRAHSVAGRYLEAVAALEKAVEVASVGPRAQSELGYAAYKAKQYEKSRRASEAALVGDPRVQAASHYNLGLVFEATGKKGKARNAFGLSHQLRPSAPARAAWLRTGGKESVWNQPLSCEERPMNEGELKVCLGHGRADEDESGVVTSVEVEVKGAFAVVTESQIDGHERGTRSYYLAHRDGDQLSIVADLAGQDSVTADIDAEVKIDAVAELDADLHKVYRVDITRTIAHDDDSYGDIIVERSQRSQAFFCVAGKKIKCTVGIPTRGSWRATLDRRATDPAHLEHFRAFYEADPPVEWSFELDVRLDASSVRVKSTKGLRAYEATYELW